MDEPLDRPRPTSWGRILTIVALAVVAAAVVAGLVWFGFLVFIVVAMGSYGSNK
ncbi:hypothetical protein [Phycicoccus sp. 3266]|jgi:hypothetical protein|uniref:hypothetical protein n=1 Tax=Phycicoccus sp. 3266 TaxID=2817751 RepID=UPI002861395E|nr:hypothetical protein [Phycicoccus sp. 3266]MDR6861866.1 ABC-type multidrug transport system permease subunit [Phycicoccus sp. 3266]